jgi:hypothetical protein
MKRWGDEAILAVLPGLEPRCRAGGGRPVGGLSARPAKRPAAAGGRSHPPRGARAKPQALSALLPQLSANGTASKEKRYRDPRTRSSPCRSPGSPTIFESFPFDGRVTTITHHYGVDLKQNLFRWQNWVALQARGFSGCAGRSGLPGRAAGPDGPRRAALFRRARRPR